MAEGYEVDLQQERGQIEWGKGNNSLEHKDYCHLYLLLAIAERLERLADKPLAPVLADLAQLVEALYQLNEISELAKNRLLGAIQGKGKKGD